MNDNTWIVEIADDQFEEEFFVNAAHEEHALDIAVMSALAAGFDAETLVVLSVEIA
jgi:hypothetical protein